MQDPGCVYGHCRVHTQKEIQLSFVSRDRKQTASEMQQDSLALGMSYVLGQAEGCSTETPKQHHL